jgi:hypothetical protein
MTIGRALKVRKKGNKYVVESIEERLVAKKYVNAHLPVRNAMLGVKTLGKLYTYNWGLSKNPFCSFLQIGPNSRERERKIEKGEQRGVKEYIRMYKYIYI